jgi:hypothetical protein
VSVPRIAGHRDTNATACPGEALYAQLPELRRLVGNVPAATGVTDTTIGLTPPRIEFGEETTVSGRVRGADGQPLGGAPVKLQRRGARRWIAVAETTTDPEGAFAASMSPRVNQLIRARFPGNGELRASNSVQRLLGVRPAVQIVRPRRRGRVSRSVDIAGLVEPRKRRLYLVVQHYRRGRWGRPGARAVRARGGEFETYFLPGRSGRWRFYVVSKPDEKTLRGASERYEVRIRP